MLVSGFKDSIEELRKMASQTIKS